ncbi:MAG: hypothetical protein Q4P84_06005, partial [Elusimicrobiales bacterium]|nr:hypothetical protein [Elusimicrobiales bacterium]
GGQMQWTSLKLKGASSNELYLACGTTGESSVCQPTDSRGATYTENCLAGITGKITYTWDYTLCRYLKTDTCSSKKRCLTKIAYCGGNSVAHTCPEGSGGVTENPLHNCSYYQVSNHTDGFMYSARLPYEVYKNYGMISETGCTPGTECNTCEPGKKYIQTYSARAQGCKSVSAEGDCKTLYLVPYALCGEMADCSEGTVQACSSWKDTTASGPSPFLPGEVLVP